MPILIIRNGDIMNKKCSDINTDDKMVHDMLSDDSCCKALYGIISSVIYCDIKDPLIDKMGEIKSVSVITDYMEVK